MTGTDTVAVVDLLTVNLRDFLARRFTDELARFVPPGERRRPSRVLLIDRAEDLTAHAAVFDHVLGAPVNLSVLCLAVGELGEDGLLHRPDLLARHEKAATLWVGDAEGVAWGLETAVASAVYGAAGGTPYAVPPALLDTLRRPAVFDAVIAHADRLGSRAAAPGLRAARVEVSRGRFARALAAALSRLTSDEGTWTKEPIGRRASNQETSNAPAIRAGGPVHRDLNAAHQALLQLRSTLDSGRGDLPAAVGALAAALRAAAADANAVIEACDPHTTPDPEYRQLFSHLGLDTAAAVQSTGNKDLDVLAETGQEYLAENRPLPVLADRFDETANRYGMSIRSPYLQRRQQIGIDLLIARLETLRAADALLPTPPAMAVTALATCMMVLCPGSAAVGAALGIGGFVGAAGWVRQRLRRIGLAAALPGGFMRHAAAAAVGTVLGAVASAAAGWTLWSGTARFAGGTVGAVVIAALLAAFWHHRNVAGLRAAVGADAIDGAIRQVEDLINDAARTARRRGELNDEVCNYARALGTLVRDVSDVLARRIEADEEIDGAPPSVLHAGIDTDASRELSERMSGIDAVVLRDIGDIAASTFERFAESARGSGRITMQDGEAVREDLDTRLEDYLDAVESSGVYHRPANCREPEERQRQLAALWSQAGSLPDLVRSEAGDTRITQFCTPEDLSFLETDPRRALLIPFAPRAAERLIGRARTGGRPIVWTDESRLLGVLRLVPLRPGTVTDDFQAGAGAPPTQRPAWDPALAAAAVPAADLAEPSTDELDEDD